MFAQDDEDTRRALGIVAILVALVVVFAIGMGIYSKNKAAKAKKAAAVATSTTGAGAASAAQAGATNAKSDQAMALAAQAAADAASVKIEGGVVKFFFASGKTDVAADGAKALEETVAGVKAGKKAIISGYVDNTGNADKNKEIAKLRAFAVRDLLKAAGVPEDKIELKKPEDIKAGAGAEARRVEVTLQ